MFRLALAFLGLVPALALAGAFEDAEALRLRGDHHAALPLYLEAAKEAHPIANHWAGTYYMEGLGTEPNPSKAAPYFLAAAHLGVPGSMVYLAGMFLTGNGVPIDCTRAEYWIARASDGSPAKEWKDKLSRCGKTL